MRKEKNLTEMEDYLSIGQLARFTGVGIHSLRAWEKRYGAPRSQRLSSGHRRFPKEEVQRLRAVSRALESDTVLEMLPPRHWRRSKDCWVPKTP